jgi:hypothetical protein
MFVPLDFVVIYDNIMTDDDQENAPYLVGQSRFEVVYALRLGDDVWVVHAFKKKSTQGIKTPQREIDLVNERLKKLRESL